MLFAMTQVVAVLVLFSIMKAQQSTTAHNHQVNCAAAAPKSQEEVMKRFYQQLLKNFGHVKLN